MDKTSIIPLSSTRVPYNQNDKAEIATARLFSLQRTGRRIGVDAFDEFGNSYELKSTTKRHCSTSRDFDRKYISNNRRLYWIIASGQHVEAEFVIERVWFFPPTRLAPWFDKLDAELREIEERHERILSTLLDSSLFQDKELLLTRRELAKGLRKNDPNIPFSFIEANGIAIDKDHPHELRRLVSEHPIPR